jgi:hypothetical protein
VNENREPSKWLSEAALAAEVKNSVFASVEAKAQVVGFNTGVSMRSEMEPSGAMRTIEEPP